MAGGGGEGQAIVGNVGGDPPPGASGLLAGQIVDRYNRRPGSKAVIQVVDLQEGKASPGGARLDVEGQQDGYFVVQGLKPGRHYRLIARVKDGDKLLSGTALATPPNPRISILVSEEFNTPDTPGVPDPPRVPARGDGDAPGDGKKSGDGARSDGATAAPSGTNSWTTPVTSPANPVLIGRDDSSPLRPPDQPASIPGAPLPPTPSVTPGPGPGAIQGPAPGGARIEGPTSAEPRLPTVPTQVPSCVVVGQKVENFALYDLEGQAYELRRHRTGKLVLLDFWFSTCPACLQAMPHMVELNRRYGQFGLEVLGVAYEKGTNAEQVLKVRGVRGRYHLTYPTLLGAGATCPVKTYLRVSAFPTVILLDEDGRILFHTRGEGLDTHNLQDLEDIIRRHLGVR